MDRTTSPGHYTQVAKSEKNVLSISNKEMAVTYWHLVDQARFWCSPSYQISCAPAFVRDLWNEIFIALHVGGVLSQFQSATTYSKY